ncbi:MAG: diaminopimelate epimerase [Bacteroidales bacterium]|nr:diaminopimelate epimerase [Bacteroidales bacterium]
MAKIRFTKMEGLGNDYIYVDATQYAIDNPAEVSRRLSDRHFGIGADGLVLIGRPQNADFSMRMFNADGSEGKMCGNASRCIGKYVYDKGLTDKTELTLDTLSGIKHLSIHLGADGKAESVTVDMGAPVKVAPGCTAEACGRTFTGVYVDVGNPHLVIRTEDAEAVPVDVWGPAIERLPQFPGGVNVEFFSVTAPGCIRMRVWERGSGITMACGTGACATAAAAMALGLVSGRCTILMDGGPLQIENNGTLLMTGPATTVFEGETEL